MTRSLTIVLACLCLALGDRAMGRDGKAADKEGLTVGKRLPFQIARFVNGEEKGTEGCPSVMIANSAGRGVIIWARGADASAFELARALDSKAIDGRTFDRYLVVFGSEGKDLAAKAEGLKHLVVGEARKSAKEALDDRGVEAKVQVCVFFMDRREIRSAWSFLAEELTGERIAKIAGEAETFASAGR